MEQHQQPPPPPYDYSQQQQVVTFSTFPPPVPQQQPYGPGPQQPPPPYDYSPVPGQQVYYAPYLVAGQQMVNVSPCPSPILQQVYAPGPQQQVYSPLPQQQVINVGPQPISGPMMVGGFHKFAEDTLSVTCPACKNQVGTF